MSIEKEAKVQTTEVKGWSIDSDWHLSQLSWGEGAGEYNIDCDGSLKVLAILTALAELLGCKLPTAEHRHWGRGRSNTIE